MFHISNDPLFSFLSPNGRGNTPGLFGSSSHPESWLKGTTACLNSRKNESIELKVQTINWNHTLLR